MMNSMNRRKFVQTAAASPLLASFAPLITWREALQWEPHNSLPANALSPFSTPTGVTAEQSAIRPAIVPPDEQFMASLPRLMELAQLPGLEIGIVHGDRLVWQHYAGVANAQTKAPISPESIFPAASMGKQIFAYAVLQLVDEHRLDLDRTLKDYVTEDAPSGERGSRITARHILSHSSGLPNWRDQGDQPLIAAFEPGTKFRYSGEGFYYLQRCVEKITGTGCEQFMQERMFKPLGMNSSTYLWRADAGQRLVSGHRGDQPFDNRAFAEQLFRLIEKSGVPLAQWNHDRIVEEMAKTASPPHKPVPNEISPNVAFSLLTTVTDYCAFVARVTAPRRDAFDLKPETLASMMKPYSHVNSALSWGLGWGIEEDGGPRYLWQWGDNGGWKNIVMVHPESRSALVVFTNGGNGMRVVEHVVKAATRRGHALFLWV
jgi:CubicO group peptidase (beta-lactamase class C family)